MNRRQLSHLSVAFLFAVATVGCGQQAAETSPDGDSRTVSGRDIFVGTWRLTETNSHGGKDTYIMVITAGSGPNEIVITEPYGEFTATVNGSSFTFPQVTVDDSRYSAAGKLDGEKLTYQSQVTGQSVERHSSGIMLNNGQDKTYSATGVRVDTSTVDPDRETFFDTWEIVKEGQSSEDAWKLTIKAGSGGNEIILKNLTNVEAPLDRGKKGIRIGYPTEEEIFATINDNAIVIPHQWHDGTKYSGSGSLNGDAISLNVTKNEYGPNNWELVARRKGTALAGATRDDYLGTWRHPHEAVDRVITTADGPNEILIKDFWRLGYNYVTVIAIVDGSSFTVPVQEIDGFEGYTISGSGILSGVAEHDTITFECKTVRVSDRDIRGSGSYTGYRK